MVHKQQRRLKVAIIGGGICKLYFYGLPTLPVTDPPIANFAASIAQAVRLQEKLGKNVEYTIYERDTDLGGVWLNSLWKGCG